MSVILKCDRCEKEIGVVNEDKGKMYSHFAIQNKMTSNSFVNDPIKNLDLCSDCQDSFDKWFASDCCYTVTKKKSDDVSGFKPIWEFDEED